MTESGRATEAVPPALDGAQVRFRIHTGELRSGLMAVGATVDDDLKRLLPIRKVVVSGRPLWQKWVPTELGEVAPDRYGVLEAEVRALSRLAAAYPVSYPECLSRLMGYDVDAAEPYLLVEPYRGEPLEEVIGHLGPQDKVVVQQGLLQALSLIARARVVHGAVDIPALRWDGRALQLVDFHGGALSLERTDFAKDVIAAGRVVRKVVLGPQVTDDRHRDPDSLTETLDHVFDPDPARRPAAVELLARLHGHELPLIPVDPEQRWAAARVAFDDATRRKRQRLGIAGPPQRQAPAAPPAVPPPPGRRLPAKVLAVMAVGVLLVVLVALTLILGVGA